MQLLSKRVSDARNFSYILCCKSLYVRLESRGEALLKPAVFDFVVAVEEQEYLKI